MNNKYFFPYQARWLSDKSHLKIWEKSRRVGATYVQSYEDVRDAAGKNGMDVWFSSADESAAREYIRYCEIWSRIMNVVADEVQEIVVGSDKDIKALSIKFANGCRIHGLTSNPSAFRSKGGKLVLDEFAWHDDQEAMWAAAEPITTWGFPVRILSTYNGAGNRYYRMVEEAKRGNLWKLHSTPLQLAVDEGLADKILGRKLTKQERQNWLEEKRRKVGDEAKWQQEYCCLPLDETTAWLTWELIASAERDEAGQPNLYQGGDCYIGMDIGRRRDLTVIWVLEKLGDTLWTREVVRLRNITFHEQDRYLDEVMQRYKVQRICIDQTGIGEKPVEDAKRRYGWIVEGIVFNNSNKQHMATVLKQRFEDKQVRIPRNDDIKNAHHAVQRITTIAGNIRFDAERTEQGHADEFWAHALAVHAAENTNTPFGVSVEDDRTHNARDSFRKNSRLIYPH